MTIQYIADELYALSMSFPLNIGVKEQLDGWKLGEIQSSGCFVQSC